MLKIENTEVMGWEHAIRGMRNPKNSWEKSDSNWRYIAPAQKENHILASYSDDSEFWIGPNDADLMNRLRNAGTYHRNWIESTTVDEDITSPHKVWMTPLDILRCTIEMLNAYRESYLETKDKQDWWQMIQLLPSSYNQRRTVMLNYEVLANMYKSRRNHKLDEWHTFCDWIESLPYSELITGKGNSAPENSYCSGRR